MPAADFKVLAINPGSTSTKFAVYLNEEAAAVRNVRHSDEQMRAFAGKPVLEQLEFRRALIERELIGAG